MIVEKLNTGRDFVDEDGDVRHMSDFTNDMEFAPQLSDSDLTSSVRGLTKHIRANRPRGRSHPEISGRDIGIAIDNAIADAEADLGRELTDAELVDISRKAELHARGIL